MTYSEYKFKKSIAYLCSFVPWPIQALIWLFFASILSGLGFVVYVAYVSACYPKSPNKTIFWIMEELIPTIFVNGIFLPVSYAFFAFGVFFMIYAIVVALKDITTSL